MTISSFLNLNGIHRKKPILAIIYDGGGRMLLSVWAADQATEISYGFSQDLLRLVKLVPVSYCFYKKWIRKLFSVWAVGTIKHLVLLVVNCWTKFEDTWSGKCLGLMCLLFVFWGRKNVSVGRAGIDPLTVRYINVSLWSRHISNWLY